MKTVLRIANLNTNEDVISIKEVIAHSEGTIACEVNVNKKEVSIVYDDKTISLDGIIASIEELGYSVI
ncbi:MULTISPECIES: heavy-metal-associated domain-containing protein [unclassified Clostridium]|uniref:heavy-metal-associated domain-containing protein n=1 Tax=unclassified Clostridium TaxID=2614128 RepID=UPI002907532A|nr:heavy-metal-associated domain-containing protein [Clostridium sp.]MDU5106439.1 heavy-metal-associated domain-containing protein [Clostridium sp.]